MRAPTRGKRRTPHIGKARLAVMIEEATADAYGESEQVAGWCAVIEDRLAMPLETKVLGVPVLVERIDLDESEHIVAICRRGRQRQSIPILDLPMPTPSPDGASWIEAYRVWRRGNR
jgi:hypothetical protein